MLNTSTIKFTGAKNKFTMEETSKKLTDYERIVGICVSRNHQACTNY